MKKALLLGLTLLFVSGAVSAQQLALYADAERTTWCAENADVGAMVYVYLFVNPVAEGITCIELNTTHEGGMYMAFAPTYNPETVQPIMGGFPDSDLGGCFGGCQSDWIWFANVMLFNQSVEPCRIYIRPFQGPPVQEYPKVLTCGGDEIEAFPLTDFFINACGPISVEESSWGAIKSMYE